MDSATGEQGEDAVALDPQILAQLERVGGATLVEQLFRLYLTHTPRRVDRVRDGLACNDLDAVARAVHSLRSSSATLGAAELATGLEAMEAAAEDRAEAQVGDLWSDLEPRIAGLLVDLRERLGET